MKKTFTPLLLAEKGDKRYLNARRKRLAEMDSLEDTPATGTKWIPLLKGRYAIVDESDYEFLNQWNWYLKASGYPVAQIDGNKVYMHRKILNVPKGLGTDHINHNKLDARRANLRICTQQQNNFNRAKSVGATSRFKGVSWDKENNLFATQISIGRKRVNLGRFKTEEEAALRYNEAAKQHFGEFACLNQI